MENKSENIDLLFGLETYSEFLNDDYEREFIHDIIGMMKSDDVKEELFLYCLRKLDGDILYKAINYFAKTDHDKQLIKDGFSRSQVRSKIWLVEELSKISTNFQNVAILGSWFGQLVSVLDKKILFDQIRLIDKEKEFCKFSDQIFNLKYIENYRVKSICADINQLTMHKNGYEWKVDNFKEETSYVEKFAPDLIINTSAEHMTEEWYHQIRFKEMDTNPIVVIQSNNMFDGEGHVNCVYSASHMKKKFPMKEVLFEGEMQLKGYKRVMLIGRP